MGVVLLASGQAGSQGPKTTINITETPAGLVVIRPAGKAPNPAQAALLIADSMERSVVAQKRNVRASTSIVSGGNTVAVYLWCDPRPGKKALAGR